MTAPVPFIIPPWMAQALMSEYGAIPDNCEVVDLVQGEVGRYTDIRITHTPRSWTLPDGRAPGQHRAASGTTPAPRVFRRSVVSRAVRLVLARKLEKPLA